MSCLSHCVECRQKLHNTFFCPLCGEGLCGWQCYDKHTASHTSPVSIPQTAPESGAALTSSDGPPSALPE